MMASDYRIIAPNSLYGNKTYADYLKGFWRWLYSVDCDSNNSGDVVFLRGVAKPDSNESGYIGRPVVRVGDNGLTISKDQAVFFCNITTNTEAFGEREDDQEPQLRGACLADLRQSRIPDTKQILIDGKEIKLPVGSSPSDFRTVTDEYILQVPEAQYGSTIAEYMDVVLPPDEYRCVASAYCFLIEFDPGEHTVYSLGQGKPWKRGDYVSELLYEIKVVSTEEITGPRANPRFPITNAVNGMLQKMQKDGDIDEKKLNQLRENIKIRDKLRLM
jgi:hypothetical protein